MVSLAFCLNRRIAVHRRLTRISKTFHTLGKNDVPNVSMLNSHACCFCLSHAPMSHFIGREQSVYQYIQQEYTRACLIAYESRPKDGFQQGWGKPGTSLQATPFRASLLDTICVIGASYLLHAHKASAPH